MNYTDKIKEVQAMVNEKGLAMTTLDIYTTNQELIGAMDVTVKGISQIKRRKMEIDIMSSAFTFMEHLYPWQIKLNDILNGPINNRAVYWILERIGNTGKSTFLANYKALHLDDTAIVSSGKKADMMHAASKIEYRYVPTYPIYPILRSRALYIKSLQTP